MNLLSREAFSPDLNSLFPEVLRTKELGANNTSSGKMAMHYDGINISRTGDTY